ncbi:MAG: SCO family protein [Candidatus Omnitrophica bacterium]|nr:SCO family protein [Candidatus Omnitrophota bacterium]
MIRKAAGLLVVLWIAGGMAFIVWNSRKLAELPLPILGDVGAFQLTDQSARPFDSSQLNGKVWIADFIFTRCAGPCPTMSAVMRRFTEQLSGLDQVRFVSFSVDPDYDTPERLAEYGVRFHADPNRWFFLTGEKTAIYDLAEKKFRLAAADTDPVLRSPHTIFHSSKFVLIDQAGKIRGYYDSGEPFQLKAMVRSAERLVKEDFLAS